MKPTALNAQIAKLINDRLTDEYFAHYSYQAISNYCYSVGFMKAGEYFKKESDDELVHARKLQEFLFGWNVIPDLPVIAKPKLEFKTLLEVIELAYKLEIDLYNAYNDICETIEEADSAVYQFLTFFLNVQTESVAAYSDMINLCEGVPSDKLNMLLLEKKLFG